MSLDPYRHELLVVRGRAFHRAWMNLLSDDTSCFSYFPRHHSHSKLGVIAISKAHLDVDVPRWRSDPLQSWSMRWLSWSHTKRPDWALEDAAQARSLKHVDVIREFDWITILKIQVEWPRAAWTDPRIHVFGEKDYHLRRRVAQQGGCKMSIANLRIYI